MLLRKFTEKHKFVGVIWIVARKVLGIEELRNR